MDDTHYEKAIGAVRRRQASHAVALVRRHHPSARRWLDVGCSFGYLLLEAKLAGYDVIGIEPDAKAAARAQELLGDGRVTRARMTGATVPDGSTDVISMMDVLEHFPPAELPGVATTIHRKLAPGGVWLIKVPTTEGLYFILAHALNRITRSLATGVIKRLWQCEYEFPHTVYFDRQSLTVYLRRHQFEVAYAGYVEDVPNSTVVSRLRMDDTIPAWQAYVLAPAFYLVNLVERLRRKSDALVAVARRQ